MSRVPNLKKGMRMTKARVEQVGYIGWRGVVGCEVLKLHEELTGFIGAGGAGKSTLLIALNYALLPDRQMLNIKPISDVDDANNAGLDTLIGRVNPNYGYAYVVLDIHTRRQERLVAGIHVEQKDGRASFNLWTMKSVPDGMSIQDLMGVTEGEEVSYPDMPVLKRHLATRGIDMDECRVIGEYGQALYDAGILPCAMANRDDRSLYAKIIEAAFIGGISRDVTTKLKEYLLPAPTQLQDIVRGLQECTNEVLKTKSAVADANKELALIQSTYGVGKSAVITALRCIDSDVKRTKIGVEELTRSLTNNRCTAEGLTNSLPTIQEMIALTESNKKTSKANLEAEKEVLAERKLTLKGAQSEKDSRAKETSALLSKFNSGKTVWNKIAAEHVTRGFDWVEQWLLSNFKTINQDEYKLRAQMEELQDEDNRLATKKASDTSELLAETLGGQSLEHSLSHLSERESIVHEMLLGGLSDGVVGVEIDAISDLKPSKDIPDLFWLGKQVPEARAAREMGEWLVSPVAGGYMVANKHKATVFGSDAIMNRRKVIASELKQLEEKQKNCKLQADQVDAKRKLLSESKESIVFYLEHRQDEIAYIKAADDAKNEASKCKTEFKEADLAYAAVSGKLHEVEAPFDAKLDELRKEELVKRQEISRLEDSINQERSRLTVEEGRLELYLKETEAAKNVLGSAFDLFLAAAQADDESMKYVTGRQTKRLMELKDALPADALMRMPHFANVNAEDRIGVIRIWPELMGVIRDIVSSDMADTNGEDLIKEMQERRAGLDVDLERQETEVRINAKSVFANIKQKVREQKAKIDKLSRLGQTIEFGNVTGIQIKLSTRTRMLDILDGLSEQINLFDGERAVHEILQEFFSLKDIKMDGEALLDYRNYVDLHIEARRKDDDWKPASSLSGTEAIGGGLAIALMLTRSIALRGEASGEGVKVSQIRPLFAVDEVSRLNQAGQAALVEFARRENFQLLVTAPTIDPKYDCLLYALSRRFDPHETLVIRGIKYEDKVTPDRTPETAVV